MGAVRKEKEKKYNKMQFQLGIHLNPSPLSLKKKTPHDRQAIVGSVGCVGGSSGGIIIIIIIIKNSFSVQ